MAIYRYTLFKYLKSTSTWIILLISMFIAGFLGGYLPMSALDIHHGDSPAQSYAVLVIAVAGGITAFLSIFTAVFAGFKGATMFKDEVEDGTFLVMLSKPQTRAKIIFGKWLALQTLMIGYAFFSIVSFVVFVEIFDKGHLISSLASVGIGTLKGSIFKVAGYIFGILIVIGLIFSSIAILLSTKLSTGATVGISISIGVIIPITGMIASFTATQPYKPLANDRFQRMGLLLDTTANSSPEAVAKIVASTTKEQLGNSMSDADIDKAVDSIKGYISDFFKTVDHAYKIIDSGTGLFNIDLATGDKDNFKNVWGFDLNYQLRQMASVVSNGMVPEALKPQLQAIDKSGISGINLESKVISQKDKTNILPWLNNEIDMDMEVQMRWGLAARKMLIEIAKLFPIQDTDKDGKLYTVDSTTVVDDVLKNGKFPTSWLVPSGIKEYIKSPLVVSTLRILSGASFKPLSNILDKDTLLKIAPKDWKDEELMFGPNKVNLIDEYTQKYEDMYKTITGEDAYLGKDKDAFEAGLVHEAELYALLQIDAEHFPNAFAFTKTTDYVPGMTLLYVYLALALALVPISYLIVRKVDFR